MRLNQCWTDISPSSIPPSEGAWGALPQEIFEICFPATKTRTFGAVLANATRMSASMLSRFLDSSHWKHSHTHVDGYGISFSIAISASTGYSPDFWHQNSLHSRFVLNACTAAESASSLTSSSCVTSSESTSALASKGDRNRLNSVVSHSGK